MKENQKKTWKVLKQLLTSNKHASGNFDIGAESFNIFFSPVGTNVTKHYGPLILPPLLERTTHFCYSFYKPNICLELSLQIT